MSTRYRRTWVMCIVFSLAVMTTSFAGSFEKGLVAHWPMDQGKGNVIKDVSGNGHDGIIKGAVWVNGRIGKGLAFDGLDDWVDCGEVFTESSVKTFTVSLWTKFNAKNKYCESILFIGNDSLGGYAVALLVGSRKQVWCSFNHGGTRVEAFDSDKGWHHIVVVYDGTYCRLYRDAEEVCNAEYTKPVDFSGFKTSFGFGYRKDCGFYLSGFLDEARIYDRALSANEIAQLYKTDCKKIKK